MTPKPKKPPDPSQPLSPSSSLVSLHSYPLSLNSPSLNLANYASYESHFPTTQPYPLLCLLGCLSSAPIITIGAASFDGKMEHWGIPFKLKSRFAIPFRCRFRSMLVLGGSIFTSATVVTDQGIQRQGISCLLLSKPATGMLVKGNLNSHNYASGVFVPFFFYVLTHFVLTSLSECLHPLLWYLILRVVVCLYKTRRRLRSARRHLLNLPKTLCLVQLNHRSPKFVNLGLQSSHVEYVNLCFVPFAPFCYWGGIMLGAIFLLVLLGPFWFTRGFPCGWGTMVIPFFVCCYNRSWLVIFSRWVVKDVLSRNWASFRCIAMNFYGLQVFVLSMQDFESVQTIWSRLISLDTWFPICKTQIEIDCGFLPRTHLSVNICSMCSSEDKQDFSSTLYIDAHHPKSILLDGIRFANCLFLGTVFECYWWNEGMTIVCQVRGVEFLKFNSQAHGFDRSFRVKQNKHVLLIDNYENCYRCLVLILVELSLCHCFLSAHPICNAVCINYLMNWRFESYLGVITPREQPSCYWCEAVCRFILDIISVAAEDIQRDGFEIGLELCVFQCKHLWRFSFGILVATYWFVDVGMHQKAFACIRYVFLFALWHHGYLPCFPGSIHVARMATCFDGTIMCLTMLGSSITPCLHFLRPEMQLQASKRVIGKQDQVLGNSTFMFWLYFDMYWVYMIDFFLLLIVLDKAVNWLSEVFSYLFYACSLWFVWFVAQYDCVLGPCLTALEQHRSMLGLARRGLGIKNNHHWTIFGVTRVMCCSTVQCSL